MVLPLNAHTFRTFQDFRKEGVHRDGPTRFAVNAAVGASSFLTVVAQGKLGMYVAKALPMAIDVALEGDTLSRRYGPVLDAAEEVGAEIVLAMPSLEEHTSAAPHQDAHSVPAADAERDASISAILRQRMGPDANAAADAAFLRALAHHGCLNPDETVAAGYKLIVEAALFGSVRHENLAALRACRAAARDIVRESELIVAAPAVRAAGGVAPPVAAAVVTSRDPGERHSDAGLRVLEERFARAMQQPTAPGRDVVGVCPSYHVTGISRAWAGARSQKAAAVAAELPGASPADAAAAPAHTRINAPALTAVGALGAGAFALRKLLKSARPVRNAALACGAGAAASFAAFAVERRTLMALLEADMRLRAFEQYEQRRSKALAASA